MKTLSFDIGFAFHLFSIEIGFWIFSPLHISWCLHAEYELAKRKILSLAKEEKEIENLKNDSGFKILVNSFSNQHDLLFLSFLIFYKLFPRREYLSRS